MARKAAAKKAAADAAAEGPLALAEFRKIPAFSGMGEEDARLFLGLMKERPVARGEPLFREGETGDGLYVVLRGRVSIVKKNEKGGEREIAVLEKHEVAGEMDLISDRGHTAGAKGSESTVLLLLPKREFQRLLRDRNPGAISMLVYFSRMLAGRLDNQNKQMMAMLDGVKKPAGSEFSEFKRRLLKEWSF